MMLSMIILLKLLAQNYMVIGTLIHGLEITGAQNKISGQMMLFVLDQNKVQLIVDIDLLDNMIVIGKLNVFSYSALEEDLAQEFLHQFTQAKEFYQYYMKEKLELYVMMYLINKLLQQLVMNYTEIHLQYHFKQHKHVIINNSGLM